MKSRAFLIAAAVAFVAACGPAPSDDATAGGAANDRPTTAKPLPAVTSTLLSSDQASLRSCDPVIATISWDVRKQHPAVGTVQIFAGLDSNPVLFSAGGANGRAETGRWVKPGTIFRLRDAASGDELSRIVIGGPECPARAKAD